MTGVDPNAPQTLESSGKFYKDYTQFLDVDDLSGARISVARNFFGGNAEVDQAVNAAIEKMEDLGATIVDSTNFPEDVLDSVGDI
jgi:amidase